MPSTSDANLFSIDGANKFNANVSSVNSADGLWVTVTYTPDSVGIHSTRLVISGGGIKGSVGIGLKGQCFPTPQRFHGPVGHSRHRHNIRRLHGQLDSCRQ